MASIWSPEDSGSWYMVFFGTLLLLFFVTWWYYHYLNTSPLSFHRDIQYSGDECSVFSIKGRRKHMEDTFRADGDLFNDGKLSFYAVFDGHGGSKASAFCANRLHQHVKSTLTKEKKKTSDWASNVPNVKTAIHTGFCSTDQAFLAQAAMHDWPDGTTAVAALVIGSKSKTKSSGKKQGTSPSSAKSKDQFPPTGAQLYVANTGDSRAVLVRDGRAIPLSDDQKPNRADERARIEASGGRVIHFGTWRVEGVLAVARALGDQHLKQWVIPDPEIRYEKLTEADTALVLASDGVWDVLTNQDVADLCTASLNRAGGTMKSKLDYLARQITKKAYDKGSVDNITTLVVDLTAFTT